jgi:hypothetical protein
VGLDQVGPVSAASGLRLTEVWADAGRWFVALADSRTDGRS